MNLDVLCAYFQYGLKLKSKSGKTSKVVAIYASGDVSLENGAMALNNQIGFFYKPVLVPLSELTDQYAKELGFKDTKSLRLAIAKGELNYNQFDNLASEHYDLFGLFEDNLAEPK